MLNISFKTFQHFQSQVYTFSFTIIKETLTIVPSPGRGYYTISPCSNGLDDVILLANLEDNI